MTVCISYNTVHLPVASLYLISTTPEGGVAVSGECITSCISDSETGTKCLASVATGTR